MSGTYDYDLVTLGAGSGGVRASRFSAQQYGAKVACIELPFGFISSETVGGAGGTVRKFKSSKGGECKI